MLPVTSCQTTRTETKYVYIVPSVEWPVFPSIEGVTYNAEDDTVTVSGDFWAELACYKRDIDKIKQIYREAGE